MYNLLRERWIPVKRKISEKPEYISPYQITTDPVTNPVIALDSPRPDFNGALIQFLIGLVQTACPPADESEWRKKFRNPPSPDELKAAFEQYTDAFNLDGAGPRFMQDLDLTESDGEHNKTDHLLMEMPGDQTVEKNTDHFLKRDTVKNICQSCCSMALFTLQTNAPSGGRGHRTSLRGGGPLTTLILGRTLWETIWLNVITRESFSHFGNTTKNTESDMFPWMGHTRTSEKNEITTSQHVHPVQMFWGMPRRIRIIFAKSHEPIQCDLCGHPMHDYTSEYFDKSYGINYKDGWHHILSPYSTDLKTGESLPRHGQPGGISYRNWLGLIQNSSEKNFKSEPAVVVHLFREERGADLSEVTDVPFRLWAFGYDMDNMKARCWYEGMMPLTCIDKEIRPEYEAGVSQMIKTANLISSNVRMCLKDALFSPDTKVSLDKSFFETMDSRFWQETESEFYQTLVDLKNAIETRQSLLDLKLHWLAVIANEGERLFDYYSQSNQIALVNPRRVAIARRNLRVFSSKNNKKIIELLDLPKQEKKEPLKARSTSKKKT